MVTFHGACNGCSMNLDALRISKCNTNMLSFPDMYDTLRLVGNTYFFGIVKTEYRSKNCVLFEIVFFLSK